MPSFVVLHAKVSVNLYRQVDLDLGASNLGDRNYSIVDGYPESGRLVRLSLNYRF